jgi:hypothetical protein
MRSLIFALLVGLVVMVTACEDAVSPPPNDEPTWSLEPDSMNLGILVLDYLTYEFIGGRVDHYAPCDTCDRNGLPFEVIYNPPVDYGDITFRYIHTGDTLLYATTVWNGWGQIEYPEELLGSSAFEWLAWRFAPPTSVQYYINSGEREPWADADTAWSRVAPMNVVGEFAKSNYRVGIFYYGAANMPMPYALYYNRWVIFLYRARIADSPTSSRFVSGRVPSNNRIQLTAASVTRAAEHPARRPAGYGGRGRR